MIRAAHFLACLYAIKQNGQMEESSIAKDDPGMRGYRPRNRTDGRLRDTRDDKHVGTLEKQYDRDFGVRSDMHVDTLLKQTGYSSVSKLIKSGIGKKK